ncbi:MAG: Rieske 2Fe-2S domain-containing protein [Chloroflexi bacterium]|nr:Rieske 2Fe-2S domain-containing protein [Chloroflexota bacterium]
MPRGAVAAETRRRWRGEFPYHWDADDLTSRRGLLQFAVYASGALFASTGVLAVLGAVRSLRIAEAQQVALASQVPPASAVYFNYPDSDSQAMLLHLPSGEFVAFSQRCSHLSCAVYYQPEQSRLYCPCHEGVFSPETGDPVAGPPQRRLAQITLRQDGDVLYATEIQP